MNARFLSSISTIALLCAGAISTHTIAQDKPAAKTEKGAAKITTVIDNEKVRVFEAKYRPGDEANAVPSASSRVLHALKGGTITRTYSDGKIEKVEYKTGETVFLEPSKATFTAKNTGKSDIHLLIVQLK